jgi:threonine synthase
MGAPIARFVAATNVNKTVPDYLSSGRYEPRPSVATISNAMDVGAPSNFERMTAHWSFAELGRLILGAYVSDDETKETIARVRDASGYVLDPHGAVGWKALDDLEKRDGRLAPVRAVLATAHPAKFAETVEPSSGSAGTGRPSGGHGARRSRDYHTRTCALTEALMRWANKDQPQRTQSEEENTEEEWGCTRVDRTSATSQVMFSLSFSSSVSSAFSL